jgi:hypothetical protein
VLPAPIKVIFMIKLLRIVFLIDFILEYFFPKIH